MGKILVVSNMYPDKKFPSYGVFVKRFCDELEECNYVYDKSVVYNKSNKLLKIIEYFAFFIKTFFKYFKKENEIIYIHYASHSSIPILFASIFRKKKIYTNVHGSDVVPITKTQKLLNIFTKKSIKKSDKIIVPSEYFKNYIIKNYEAKAEKIFIYPSCGVDKNIFYPCNIEEIKQFKKEYGFVSTNKIFGFVGRITKGKGWLTFCEAIKIINEDEINNEFEFVMVGSGPDDNELNKYIETNKIKNIKRFPLLNQDELCKIYNCLDCFVFPTENESLGLVGLESMACKCPVICSDETAPSYYVNENNGMKFKKGSSRELSDCIKKMAHLSNHKIDAMKEAAYCTAMEYEKVKIRDILKNILE